MHTQTNEKLEIYFLYVHDCFAYIYMLRPEEPLRSPLDLELKLVVSFMWILEPNLGPPQEQFSLKH